MVAPPNHDDFHTETKNCSHIYSNKIDEFFLEDFHAIAHMLGFQNRYEVNYPVFHSDEISFLSKNIDRYYQVSGVEKMNVTQKIAFHPNYSNAWMSHIYWQQEWDEVDENHFSYHQFHFRCPNALLPSAREMINTHKPHLQEIPLTSEKFNSYPVSAFYTFGDKCIKRGLQSLWEAPFYKDHIYKQFIQCR